MPGHLLVPPLLLLALLCVYQLLLLLLLLLLVPAVLVSCRGPAGVCQAGPYKSSGTGRATAVADT
jgi:hypothetical protein